MRNPKWNEGDMGLLSKMNRIEGEERREK